MHILRFFSLVFAILALANSGAGQTVLFSENFNSYPDGTTTGNSPEGLTWTTDCPACIPPDDFFEVQGGSLRGEDTNGPATFSVNNVDATGCLLVTFQFDYTSLGYSGSGNLECVSECNFGPDPCTGLLEDAISNDACNNCWDFLAWEINSGSANDNNVVLGEDCDATTGSVESDPLCVQQSGADPSDVDVTITMSMWGNGEFMEIDNVTILCYTETQANDEGIPIPPECQATSCEVFIDDVFPTDPTCHDGNDGEIEIDASALGLSGDLEYSIDNGGDFQSSAIFMGLTPGTYDIVVQDDNDPSCFATTTITINNPTELVANTPPAVIICFELLPPGGEILNLDEVLDAISNFDPSVDVNLYFDEDGNNPLDPLDPADITSLIVSGETTIYATITDGICESNTVPVSLDLNEYPTSSDGMLEECLGSNGVATFDPGDADDQFNGGDPSLIITYHSNAGDAATGNNPITGIVTTPSDMTLFVRIEDAAGCAGQAELELIVTDPIEATDAGLTACDDGSGEGNFDLTTLENDILNGESGTVIFYEDSGLGIEILDPANYTGPAGTIFAIIDDGSGCASTVAEITLDLITLDPFDFFLTFSPDEGCGPTLITPIINAPADGEDYTFEISYGPVSSGPTSTVNIIGQDGAGPFTIQIDEPYVFILETVTQGIGVGNGCQLVLDPFQEFIIDISAAPEAFPAEITACLDASGEGTYDLTTLENTINGNTGDPVVFYEDFDLNFEIFSPANYESSPGTIYAIVDGGAGCESAAVEITLEAIPEPDPVEIFIDQTESCSGTDVTLSFDFPTGEDFDITLTTTNSIGTTTTDFLAINNGLLITLPVTETTTYSITEITTESGCPFTLDPAPAVTITITAITANPASLSECDDGTGVGIFDLTSVNETVNGNTGESVLWFTDAAGNNPINNPTNFSSGSTTVFAAVAAPDCISETAEVMLTLLPNLDLTFTIDQEISCNQASDGALTVSVNNGQSPFGFDWSDDQYDGQSSLSMLGADVYELTVTDDLGCTGTLTITLTEPTELELVCNPDGSDTYTFDYSGGTPPYQLDLAGPTPLSDTDDMAGMLTTGALDEGNYTFTLTDANGCMVDCVFTIDANCDLTTDLTGTDPLCSDSEDGMLLLTINSSSAITSIDWNVDALDELSMIDDIGAGTYSVVVTDANGCTSNESLELVAPDALDLNCANTIDASSPTAADGVINLMVNGGTAPYEISWTGASDGMGNLSAAGNFFIQNLLTGNYTITVVDANGCTADCSSMVNAPGCDLNLDLTGTDPGCNGGVDGTVNLTIDGSFVITTIDWNNNDIDGMTASSTLSAGEYSVTVTDEAGCTANTSITLNDPPALVADCTDFTHPTTNVSTDGSVNFQFSGGTAPYTISWTGTQTGMTTATVVGSTLVDNLVEGTYNFIVTDANDCQAFCTVNLVAGGICTFPMNIQVINETCEGANDGSAFAMPMGTPPYEFTWSNMATTAMITDLADGQYFVTVTDANDCEVIQSITVQAGAPAPSLTVGEGGAICAGECFQLSLTATGQAPFIIDFAITSNNGTTTSETMLADNNGTIQICPQPLGIVGPFSIEFTNIEDLSCISAISETANFEALAPIVTDLSPTLCTGDSLVVGNMVFNENIPMGSVLLAGALCDSTVNVNLSYFPASSGTIAATLCAGDSIVVGTTVFNESNPTGTVILPAADINDCDSTVTVMLDFFPAATFDLITTICPTDTVTVGDQQFFGANNSGTVILENGSANGCDSIVFVQLDFFTNNGGNIEATICSNDSLEVDGEFFSIDRPFGIVEHDTPTVNGCDSLTVVTLSFIEPSTFELTGSLCPGDTILVGNQEFFQGNSTGMVLLDNEAANGCDSIVMVNLEELQISTNNIVGDLCPGDSIVIAGVVFNESNLIEDILLTGLAANGCDSLITVELTLVPLVSTPLVSQLCIGETLLVGDSLLQTAGSYDILLEDAAASGCDSLVQVDLSFFPMATGDFTGNFCLGEVVEVGDSTFTADQPSGEVILSGASSNGCDSIVMVDLTFFPAVTFDLDTTLCAGSSLQVGDETFDTAISNGMVILPGAAANGCDSTVFINLNFLPELTASIGPDTLLCGAQTTDITVDLSGGVNYDLNIVSSAGATISFEDVNEESFNFSPGNINTNTTLTLESVIADNGCPVTIIDDEAEILYSNPQLSLQSIGGSGGTDLSCADSQDGVIQANISDGIGPFTYEWSDGSNEQVLNNLTAGNYALTLTDLPGCIYEASITLSAPSPLVIEASGQAADCFGISNGQVTIDSIYGGNGPYEYSLDNEFFSGSTGFPILINNLAPGAYTVFVQDMNDCTIALPIGVPTAQELTLELGDDEVIQLGDSILLDPEYFFGVASWSWSPPLGLSQPDSIITYAAPQESTLYELTLTDLNGCTVSDLIRIIVERDLNVFVPNVFSPDNDGTNDRLMVFADQSVAEITRFQIFDRWGSQVYNQGPFLPNDPNFGWDGTYNGEDLNAAVFVYFVEVRLITGETVMVKGDVMLIR